jgi:hypothetical protein
METSGASGKDGGWGINGRARDVSRLEPQVCFSSLFVISNANEYLKINCITNGVDREQIGAAGARD